MGELRNTNISNVFGEGKVQEYITDDGRKFTIENTPVRNVFGGGHEQVAYDDRGNKYLITNSPISNIFGGGQQKVVEKIASAPRYETTTYTNPYYVPYDGTTRPPQYNGNPYCEDRSKFIDEDELLRRYHARQQSFGKNYLKALWMGIALCIMLFFLFAGLFTVMTNGFLGALYFILAGVAFLFKSKPQRVDFCIMLVVLPIVLFLFVLKLFG